MEIAQSIHFFMSFNFQFHLQKSVNLLLHSDVKSPVAKIKAWISVSRGVYEQLIFIIYGTTHLDATS